MNERTILRIDITDPNEPKLVGLEQSKGARKRHPRAGEWWVSIGDDLVTVYVVHQLEDQGENLVIYTKAGMHHVLRLEVFLTLYRAGSNQ